MICMRVSVSAASIMDPRTYVLMQWGLKNNAPKQNITNVCVCVFVCDVLAHITHTQAYRRAARRGTCTATRINKKNICRDDDDDGGDGDGDVDVRRGLPA